MAYQDLGNYLENVRPANESVVTSTAILNTDAATIKLSAYGPYYAQNQKMGKLLLDALRNFNIANP